MYLLLVLTAKKQTPDGLIMPEILEDYEEHIQEALDQTGSVSITTPNIVGWVIGTDKQTAENIFYDERYWVDGMFCTHSGQDDAVICMHCGAGRNTIEEEFETVVDSLHPKGQMDEIRWMKRELWLRERGFDDHAIEHFAEHRERNSHAFTCVAKHCCTLEDNHEHCHSED